MLRSIKYGLYGAVLAGLVAAPVAWGAVDKTVHLVVDGKSERVSTSASDVSGVLANRHLQLGAHDLVAPNVQSKVHSGMTIVLRHGRLLRLDVDGKRKDVWTTAATVSQALAQLGYTSTDFVSVSRSRRLPLSPTGIAIRTPRSVTVVHDGSSERVSTTDVTVGQLLRDIKVTVGPKDTLSAPQGSTLAAGQVVTLTRSGERTVTRTVLVHYPVTQVADPAMAAGTTKTVAHGKDGSMKITYAATSKNGKLVAGLKLASTMVRKPQAEVVRIGTHTASTADAAGSMTMTTQPQPGSAKAIAKALAAQRGWGADQYSCLIQMWTRESGWRTDAANPSGAYGIPQALPGNKMAAFGSDWQTNATTQIKWGLHYIESRYHTPCGAWSWWQAHNWY